ncbi:MAG: hypothetical protein KDD50_13640 [Bdellovibrionales bacterium]|nr:hypothetical protein [Bdellovibrionales bacterium]
MMREIYKVICILVNQLLVFAMILISQPALLLAQSRSDYMNNPARTRIDGQKGVDYRSQIKGVQNQPRLQSTTNKQQRLSQINVPPGYRPLTTADYRELQGYVPRRADGQAASPEDYYHVSKGEVRVASRAGAYVKYYEKDGIRYRSIIQMTPDGPIEILQNAPTIAEIDAASPRGLKNFFAKAKRMGKHVGKRFLLDSAGFYIANNMVAYGANKLSYFNDLENPSYQAAAKQMAQEEGDNPVLAFTKKFFEIDKLVAAGSYSDPAWVSSQIEHTTSIAGSANFMSFIAINSILSEAQANYIRKKQAFDVMGFATKDSQMSRFKGNLLLKASTYPNMAAASLGSSVIVEMGTLAYQCTFPKIMNYIQWEIDQNEEHHLLTECNRAYYNFQSGQTALTWLYDTTFKLLPAAGAAALSKWAITGGIAAVFNSLARGLVKTGVLGTEAQIRLLNAQAARAEAGIKWYSFKKIGDLHPIERGKYFPTFTGTLKANPKIRIFFEGFEKSATGRFIAKFKMLRGNFILTFGIMSLSFANFVAWDRIMTPLANVFKANSHAGYISDEEKEIKKEITQANELKYNEEAYLSRLKVNPEGYSGYKIDHLIDRVYNYGRYQANWREFLMVNPTMAHASWTSFIDKMSNRYRASEYFYSKFMDDYSEYKNNLESKPQGELSEAEARVVDLFKPRKFNYLEGVKPSEIATQTVYDKHVAFYSPIPHRDTEEAEAQGLYLPYLDLDNKVYGAQQSLAKDQSFMHKYFGQFMAPKAESGEELIENEVSVREQVLMQKAQTEEDIKKIQEADRQMVEETGSKDAHEAHKKTFLESIREGLFGSPPEDKTQADNRPELKPENISVYYSPREQKEVVFIKDASNKSPDDLINGRRITIESAAQYIDLALEILNSLEGEKTESRQDHSYLSKRLQYVKRLLLAHLSYKYKLKDKAVGEWTVKEKEEIQSYWDQGVAMVYKAVNESPAEAKLCSEGHYQKVYCIWNSMYEALGKPQLRGEAYLSLIDKELEAQDIQIYSEDHYKKVETKKYGEYLLSTMACGPSVKQHKQEFLSSDITDIKVFRKFVNSMVSVDMVYDEKNLASFQDIPGINMNFWGPRITNLVNEETDYNICNSSLSGGNQWSYLTDKGDGTKREYANPLLWSWTVKQKDPETNRVKRKHYSHMVDLILDNIDPELSKYIYREKDNHSMMKGWWARKVGNYYERYLRDADAMYRSILENSTLPTIYGPNNYAVSKEIDKLWPETVDKEEFEKTTFMRHYNYGIIDSIRLELDFYQEDVLIPVLTYGLDREKADRVATTVRAYMTALVGQLKGLVKFDENGITNHQAVTAAVFNTLGMFYLSFGFEEQAKAFSTLVDPHNKDYQQVLRTLNNQLSGFDPGHPRASQSGDLFYIEKQKKNEQLMQQFMSVMSMQQQAIESVDSAAKQKELKCQIIGVDNGEVSSSAVDPDSEKNEDLTAEEKALRDKEKKTCESMQAVKRYNEALKASQPQVKLKDLQKQIVLEAFKNIAGIFTEVSGYVDYIRSHDFFTHRE